MTSEQIRVGVDIGGTFTDVAMEYSGGLATVKVLTNYANPEQAILDGIESAAEQAGVRLADISQVVHGTTLVTNALIQRRGARTAFITTDGFRDVIEMRTENRFEQYDLNLSLPKPLVARADRYTLKERIGAKGDVLRAIDPEDLNSLTARVADGGYEAVAIGFMHSYTNSAHEVAVADALTAAMPDAMISISSVISPQMREFERFNTVIANAYVRPQVAEYLGRLVALLRKREITAPVFMMHSGGGLISIETASEQPVRLLESGPAGGAIFAAEFATSHSIDQMLSFDMGGTTAKICLVEGGKPKTANRFEIARTYRFKKGSGMPVSTPVVEMVEIGAGGGSIASIDAMNQIRVGPKSAGSEPGPACYQRNGTDPTVTDANLLLGRLDPDNFAGGAIPLSTDAARQAVQTQLTGKIDLDVEAASFGVTEMVDENMANAARVHTVENGRDITSFSMIAFGGGAPLHACRLCEKLGISSLLIPSGAGVGSAIGFLQAPFSYEATKGMFQRLSEFDADQVNQVLNNLDGEVRHFVKEGAGDAATETTLLVFMRYAGQGSEVPVEMPYKAFTPEDVTLFKSGFEDAYRTLFGRIIEDLAVEITNWSLVVSTVRKKSKAVTPKRTGAAVSGHGQRQFFDAALRRTVLAQEIARGALSPGDLVVGPAVITEDETSTIVTSGFSAIAQTDGSLLLLSKNRVEAAA